jgi:hypothetical protein
VHYEARVAVDVVRKQFGNPGMKLPPLETGTRGLVNESIQKGFSACCSELRNVVTSESATESKL